MGNRQRWHMDVTARRNLNMDVNLRRLPQNIDCISKFLESLADIMLVSVADGQSEVSGQSNRKDKTAESKNV